MSNAVADLVAVLDAEAAAAEAEARAARERVATARAAAIAAAQGSAAEIRARAIAERRAARPAALAAVLDLAEREERLIDAAAALAVGLAELERTAAASSDLRARAGVDNPRVGLVLAQPIRQLVKAAEQRRRSLARVIKDARQAMAEAARDDLATVGAVD